MPGIYKLPIIRAKQLSPQHWLLAVPGEKLVEKTKPGQFVVVRLPAPYDPLRKIPLSICDITQENGQVLFWLLVQTIGKKTNALGNCAYRFTKGEEIILEITGPLGQGFGRSVKWENDQLSPWFVAGGVGIAAFPYLARKLIENKYKPKVFIGGSTANKVIYYQELKALGCEVEIATDDGSLGSKGTVVDRVKQSAAKENKKHPLYACGPMPMLKVLAKWSREQAWELEVCLEEMMGCGIGCCIGCVIEKSDGKYERVCTAGPVFNAEDIKW